MSNNLKSAMKFAFAALLGAAAIFWLFNPPAMAAPSKERVPLAPMLLPADCTYVQAIAVGESPIDGKVKLLDADTGQTLLSQKVERFEQFRLEGKKQFPGESRRYALVFDKGEPYGVPQASIWESVMPPLCPMGD